MQSCVRYGLMKVPVHGDSILVVLTILIQSGASYVDFNLTQVDFVIRNTELEKLGEAKIGL